MTTRRLILSAGASAAALSLTRPAWAQSPLKVGFVYLSPRHDKGWTENHERARLAVEQRFGNRISTTFVENVAEGPDSERVMRQLAQSGHGLIFATSFGYMNPALKVAEQFPNVKFEHVSGYKRAKNLSTYAARYYEGRHILGLMAGHMSKSGVVGYIASFPTPGVIRGINAAFLAARKVNPKVQFKVVYVNSWFDPGKEADAAKALVQQGADVLMQHTDSPSPMKVAEENKIFAFGQATDMRSFGPNAQLTALIFNWGPYYIRRVQAVLDGTWESTDTWEGIGTGMVQFAPYSERLTAKAKEDVAAAIAAMTNGSMHPFTGPLNRQDGSVWMAAGQRATDDDLKKVNFYVAGIEGALPK